MKLRSLIEAQTYNTDIDNMNYYGATILIATQLFNLK